MISHSIGNWDYVWHTDSTWPHVKHRKVSPKKFVSQVPKREWVLLDNKYNYLALSLTGFFWRKRTKTTYWKTYSFNYGPKRPR